MEARERPVTGLDRRLREVCRVGDARRQVTRATELLEDLRVAELAVSQVRDAAIIRLHQEGLTYQEIAGAAGLTRGRVAQVIQRARRLHEPPPAD